MKNAAKLIQVVIALAIYDVWLVRSQKATRWRGRGAKTLRKEFLAYGLPSWSIWPVGALKLGSATLLLLGLRYSAVTRPAAVSMAALMAGAVSMHLKVRDPLQRSLPALTLLALSVFVARTAHHSGLLGTATKSRQQHIKVETMSNDDARTNAVVAAT